MNKLHKILFMGTVTASVLTGCNDRLDVTNPNYFTDEQIEDNILINGTEEQKRLAIEGMANTMKSYIAVQGYAAMTGGFSNSYASELSFEFAHSLLMGDIVEGSELNKGSFYQWYSNDPTHQFWRYTEVQNNYGNYIASAYKIGAALKVLGYLSDEVVAGSTALKEYRARCLTVLALGYVELMEIYTDLQDVTSTTKQGMPIYTKYAYNQAVEPSSVADTWAQIMTWLNQAVTDFSACENEGYTTGQDVNTIYDVDCAVTNFVLARAALDCKDYQTAIKAGEAIMARYPNFIKEENYGMNEALLPEVAKRDANGFVKDYNAKENAFYNVAVNPETIFGWQTGSNYVWNFANTLKLSGLTCWQIDKALYDQISDNDYRKQCYTTQTVMYPFYSVIGTDTTINNKEIPLYATLKFAATDALEYSHHDDSHNTAHMSYYRSSAALLMLAEAYAQSGNDAKAKEWLNKLLAARTKSGATTMTCDNTMSGKSALEMCKLQWRIETWGEQDWVFINAKRWNEIPPRAGSNHWSTTKVDLSHLTWEIPNAERLGNPYWEY